MFRVNLWELSSIIIEYSKEVCMLLKEFLSILEGMSGFELAYFLIGVIAIVVFALGLLYVLACAICVTWLSIYYKLQEILGGKR